MQFKTPEDFHNKIGFAFHALLAPPLAVFVYLFLEIKNRGFKPAMEESESTLVIISMLIFFSLAEVIFGYFLFKKQCKESGRQETLPQKLSAYFKTSLIFYGMMEIGSIVMIVGLYLTTSSFFIAGYMFLLLVLSLNRPTPQKYVNDLRLNKEERDIILHKKKFDLVN